VILLTRAIPSALVISQAHYKALYRCSVFLLTKFVDDVEGGGKGNSW